MPLPGAFDRTATGTPTSLSAPIRRYGHFGCAYSGCQGAPLGSRTYLAVCPDPGGAARRQKRHNRPAKQGKPCGARLLGFSRFLGGRRCDGIALPPRKHLTAQNTLRQM